jgi:hypothetical protein
MFFCIGSIAVNMANVINWFDVKYNKTGSKALCMSFNKPEVDIKVAPDISWPPSYLLTALCLCTSY